MKYMKPEIHSFTEEELQKIICASATTCSGGYSVKCTESYKSFVDY